MYYLFIMICVLLLFACCVFFFFFKQKTAYEMRISDWSSDVCSSDLHTRTVHANTLSHFIDQRSWQAYLLPNGHARIAVKRNSGDSIYLGDFADRKSVV